MVSANTDLSLDHITQGLSGVRANAGQIGAIRRALQGVENSLPSLKSIFIDMIGIHPDLVEFIEKEGERTGYGAARKFLQLWEQVILFDLKNGTTTSTFISEAVYKQFAKTHPDAFADITHVKSGVKHRPSLDFIIRHGFNEAGRILREHRFDPKDASLYDWGCGTGKPVLIAASEYDFGNVVGVDYLDHVLEIARQNRAIMDLDTDPGKKPAFRRADAVQFSSDSNNLNDECTISFAYNPFKASVMEQVVANLERNTDRSIFIYNKPRCRRFFRAANGWRLETKVWCDTDEDSRLMVWSRGFKDPVANDFEREAEEDAIEAAANGIDLQAA